MVLQAYTKAILLKYNASHKYGTMTIEVTKCRVYGRISQISSDNYAKYNIISKNSHL
jgi:hypothetical protein